VGRRDLDAKQLADLKALYGFDKPALERYVDMVASFARFDLGTSFRQNKDVWQLIKEKLPVSISLGLWTFLVSYLVSIPLGIAKAMREGSRFDTLTTLGAALRLRDPGLRPRRAADRAVRGGTFLDWFPCAASSPTTGGALLAGADRRLPVAPRAALTCFAIAASR